MWSFNHTQMQCYAVMKLLLKEFVKVKCTQLYRSVLCSYFIKTFLFWKFEAMNPSFWQMVNFQECLTYLFQEFYTCIENGVLPHYFIPRFNLLEIKLTPDAQIELLTHFRELIEGGISMIGRCASLAGVWSNFCQHRERNENEEYMRHAIQQDIHTRDVFLMRKVFTIMIHVLYLYFNNQTRDIYSRVLVAIDAEFHDNASSKLPLFTKKMICLYTNILLLNCSSQRNKSIYKHLKLLETNVFGFDIATSKLWFATFLLQQGDYCRSLQKINDVLSSIPPYAFYFHGYAKPDIAAKVLYIEIHGNTNTISRAKAAWLFDMLIKNEYFLFVPRAIQIELSHCMRHAGVRISPLTYAFYLMFLCYHGLGQYERRGCALHQLVDTVINERPCNGMMFSSFNIAGHCLLLVGNIEMARMLLLRSAHMTHRVHPFLDRHNSAYHYLSLM